MKKKCSVVLLFLLCFVALLALTGCDTRELYFSSSSYTIQVGTSFSPSVVIRPRGNDYAITGDNATIAQVSDNIITAQREGMVTLTVTSGNLESKATLYCVTDKTITPSDVKIITTHVVMFEIVNAESADLESGYLEPIYVYDGNVLNIVTPNIHGYIVDCWYADRACTEKFDLSTKIYDSITLYAKLIERETEYAVSNNLVTGLLYENLAHEELILPETAFGEPVYGIADEAFKGDTTIKRVVLPASYRTIGTSAFAGCTALEEVVVPSDCRLTTIGVNAFGVLRDQYDRIDETTACKKLTTLRLPDTVTRVGSFAFYNCTELSFDGIPAGLTEVEQYSFTGTKINDVSFGNVLRILEGAFMNCSTLDTVTDTTGVAQCEKYVFSGTKLLSDARKAYGESPSNKKDEYAAYYADTILYGCYSYYGTVAGSGKLRVKNSATLIADEAFADDHQKELTLYLDTEEANGALHRNFLGKNVFVDSVGVFLVVPENLVDAYKDRYNAENVGRNYADKIVCEEVVTIEGNADTINLGVHHLLKRVKDDNDIEYYYDRYEGGEEGTAKIIRLLELGVAYDVVRINMNAFVGIQTLRILGVGRVRSIAYYAISGCGKLTRQVVENGVEKERTENVFTRIEFTDTVTPTVLEDPNSIRFGNQNPQSSEEDANSMPGLFAYVRASDLTSYRSAWEGKTTALSRLTVD